MSKERYGNLRLLRVTEGQLAFSLDCFGDYLAKREKYKEHEGMEAVHFYLVQKHHWLPSVVRAMSWDDLRFVLAEEMSGWTLPKQARD